MGGPAGVERLWRSRLRWRMRGAWLWPAFAALTVADGVLLHRLPPYDGGPRGLVGGMLLAGFANLILVAVVAPFVARALRSRRPDLPRAIAENYAGTALVCALAAGIVAAGVAHRPAVVSEEADRRVQLAAVREYVVAQAPSYEDALTRADTIRLEPDMYRTCVPGADPKRWLCLYVQTDQHPPGVRLDDDRSPNSAYRMLGGFR